MEEEVETRILGVITSHTHAQTEKKSNGSHKHPGLETTILGILKVQFIYTFSFGCNVLHCFDVFPDRTYIQSVLHYLIGYINKSGVI